MITEQLTGTGAALVTPFTTDNQVDVVSLRNLVEYVINGGVEFIVVLGTTGEPVTLTNQEKQLVRETIEKANNKRLPLVLGVGGNNTQEVINELQSVDLSPYIAILSVTPYYNKPTQNGIYAHFAEVAKNSPLPLIIYNVPSRTGVCMSAATTIRLANDFENIVAVKEASGDMLLDMEIIKDKPKDFLFLSGDDMFTLPSIWMGGSGVITVVGVGFPKEFSEMVRLGLQGKIAEANALHYQLMPQTVLAFKEGNPVGIKAILEHKGLCSAKVRLPLVEASAELKTAIKVHN